MAVIAAAVTYAAIEAGRYTLKYTSEYYDKMINRLKDHQTKMNNLLDELGSKVDGLGSIWAGDEGQKARQIYQETKTKVNNYNRSIERNIQIIEETKAQMRLLNGVDTALDTAQSAIAGLSR